MLSPVVIFIGTLCAEYNDSKWDHEDSGHFLAHPKPSLTIFYGLGRIEEVHSVQPKMPPIHLVAKFSAN